MSVRLGYGVDHDYGVGGQRLMLVIPGAMAARLDSALFWGSLVLSLAVAGAAAFPVNWWLIARGRGHAVIHQYHRPEHR
jgi:hypothetical protein